MSIQSVSNVSFGATSKNGNEYKKSHVGTIAGTVAGAGLATLGATRTLKNLKTIQGKREYVTDALAIANTFVGKGNKASYVKGALAKGIKPGIAIGMGLLTVAGLGIGALINKAINAAKANKADKAAAKAQ